MVTNAIWQQRELAAYTPALVAQAEEAVTRSMTALLSEFRDAAGVVLNQVRALTLATDHDVVLARAAQTRWLCVLAAAMFLVGASWSWLAVKARVLTPGVVAADRERLQVIGDLLDADWETTSRLARQLRSDATREDARAYLDQLERGATPARELSEFRSCTRQNTRVEGSGRAARCSFRLRDVR